MLTFESEALAAGIFVAKSKTGNGAIHHILLHNLSIINRAYYYKNFVKCTIVVFNNLHWPTQSFFLFSLAPSQKSLPITGLNDNNQTFMSILW
jgi:hypothetical protein